MSDLCISLHHSLNHSSKVGRFFSNDIPVTTSPLPPPAPPPIPFHSKLFIIICITIILIVEFNSTIIGNPNFSRELRNPGDPSILVDLLLNIIAWVLIRVKLKLYDNITYRRNSPKVCVYRIPSFCFDHRIVEHVVVVFGWAVRLGGRYQRAIKRT